MGITIYLPEEEKYSETKNGLETTICTLLGGRVAEELIFASVTSGASNDIERATAIARKMVCEWGMSDKLGPLAFGEKEGEVFLGRDMGHTKNYSEATAIDIDNEIKGIVNGCYARTREILDQQRQGLVALAEALLERETLDGEEVRRLAFPNQVAEQQTQPSDAEAAPSESPTQS